LVDSIPPASPIKARFRTEPRVYVRPVTNENVQVKNFTFISHETDKQEEARQWSKY